LNAHLTTKVTKITKVRHASPRNRDGRSTLTDSGRPAKTATVRHALGPLRDRRYLRGFLIVDERKGLRSELGEHDALGGVV
jgi:hypothetical protein